MAKPIDFYFDFSSPYGYLAAQRIDEIGADNGREVVWRPILLGVGVQTTGGHPPLRPPPPPPPREGHPPPPRSAAQCPTDGYPLHPAQAVSIHVRGRQPSHLLA